MSEQNKTIVRRYFEEVWNKKNLAILGDLVGADFVDHDPVNADVRGLDGARQLVTKYLNAFPDTQFTIDEMLATGDRVVTRWTAEGTHTGELEGIPATNRKVTVSGITIDRIANGKIVESWANWDAFGMMQQLGVIPGREKAKGAS